MEDKNELLEWNKSIDTKAQNLVKKIFPERVSQLTKLMNSDKFDDISLDTLVDLDIHLNKRESSSSRQSHNENNPKRLKRSHNKDNDEKDVNCTIQDMLPKNVKIKEIINTVRPHVKQLIDDINLLKLWILLLIPRIEDGNNFGVSVQENLLEEIRTVEGEAIIYYDDINKYHSLRAKIMSKIAKYPFIEDYREALAEVDEQQKFHLKVLVREVRNYYNWLYNLLTKNWEKLICPRPSNSINSMF